MEISNLKQALLTVKEFCEDHDNCKSCPLANIYCSENFRIDPSEWNTNDLGASNND